MNILLDEKIEQLEKLQSYECWYLVKQTTDFPTLCYLVSILKKYQEEEKEESLEDFVKEEGENITKNINPEIKISTYRALRVAAFFGLISLSGSTYQNAKITPTFDEINNLCSGKFENKELYINIIQRQIEKMYISSDIDEASNNLRKEYRLFPVMLLYKVLLELGKTTGNYFITITEYRYLIATTNKFEDYLDTLILIKLLRKYPEYEEKLNKYREKFDNRMIRALNELPVLEINTKGILLNNSFIDEVAKKIYIFEKNPNQFYSKDYINFLGSTKSLVNVNDSILKDRINTKEVNTIQKIYYGAPGTGKSYSVAQLIEKEKSKYEKVEVIRTTVYQDYSYYDFIGSIQPKVENDVIKYEFTPGPFSVALKKAIQNKDTQVYLIIEEMSRGNIASIFGDTFQLLDRKNGISEYSIHNESIANYINLKCDENNKNQLDNTNENNSTAEVSLPSNLHIIGTVNTSDQNVNVMDTAFKRRFSFEYVSVEPQEKDGKHLNNFTFTLDGDKFNWIRLYTSLNKFIVERLGLSEDKQIGQFFIKFDNSSSDEENKKQVGDKLLQYLWEDVQSATISGESLFKNDIKTFGQLYDYFNKKDKNIFSDNLMEMYNQNLNISKDRAEEDK